MDDFTLVLNAGSSSLKFAIFHRRDAEGWHIGCRGHIELIGTSPAFSAKDARGRKLIDGPSPEAKDGHGALDILRNWIHSNYGGARVLGVGHRVVHGGAKYTGPVV